MNKLRILCRQNEKEQSAYQQKQKQAGKRVMVPGAEMQTLNIHPVFFFFFYYFYFSCVRFVTSNKSKTDNC